MQFHLLMMVMVIVFLMAVVTSICNDAHRRQRKCLQQLPCQTERRGKCVNSETTHKQTLCPEDHILLIKQQKTVINVLR